MSFFLLWHQLKCTAFIQWQNAVEVEKECEALQFSTYYPPRIFNNEPVLINTCLTFSWGLCHMFKLYIYFMGVEGTFLILFVLHYIILLIYVQCFTPLFKQSYIKKSNIYFIWVSCFCIITFKYIIVECLSVSVKDIKLDLELPKTTKMIYLLLFSVIVLSSNNKSKTLLPKDLQLL